MHDISDDAARITGYFKSKPGQLHSFSATLLQVDYLNKRLYFGQMLEINASRLTCGLTNSMSYKTIL